MFDRVLNNSHCSKNISSKTQWILHKYLQWQKYVQWILMGPKNKYLQCLLTYKNDLENKYHGH